MAILQRELEVGIYLYLLAINATKTSLCKPFSQQMYVAAAVMQLAILIF